MYKRTLLLITVVLYALPGLSQECHSLTGTWKMNPAKSFFAGMKTPDQQAEQETLVMVQDGSKIQQTWDYQGSQIKDKVTYEFIVDGTEQKPANPIKNRRIPPTIRPEWQNCTLITEEKVVLFGSFSIGTRNTYVLADRGRQLTILQESHNNFGDTERWLVFDRQ
jgi:hypothetical protein